MLKCYPKYKPILHTVSKEIPLFLTVLPPDFYLLMILPTSIHSLEKMSDYALLQIKYCNSTCTIKVLNTLIITCIFHENFLLCQSFVFYLSHNTFFFKTLLFPPRRIFSSSKGFVKMLPAATIELSETSAPPRIVDLQPIQTWSRKYIGVH